MLKVSSQYWTKVKSFHFLIRLVGDTPFYISILAKNNSDREPAGSEKSPFLAFSLFFVQWQDFFLSNFFLLPLLLALPWLYSKDRVSCVSGDSEERGDLEGKGRSAGRREEKRQSSLITLHCFFTPSNQLGCHPKPVCSETRGVWVCACVFSRTQIRVCCFCLSAPTHCTHIGESMFPKDWGVFKGKKGKKKCVRACACLCVCCSVA